MEIQENSPPVESASVPLLRPPSRLSVSQIKTFEQCPARYYYKYFLRLPEKENRAFSIGKMVHETLEKGIQYHLDGAPLREGVKKAYSEVYQTYKNLLTREEIDQIKGWLKEYIVSVDGHLPKVIAIEEKFKTTIEGYALIGGIDRIDEIAPDHYNIIDYKTNKDQKRLDSLQLAVYTIAVGEKYNPIKSEAEYIFIRNNQIKRYSFSNEDLDKARLRIKEAGDRIYSPDEPFIPKPSVLCSWCPYQLKCFREQETFNAW